MEQRISLITLGVADLARARRFYAEGLGWTPAMEAEGEVVFFQAGPIVFGLYTDLAADGGVEGQGRGGSGLLSIAHNVRRREEVDVVIEQARAAGARVTKPAHDTGWGGRSGYFTDLDGHLWEIGWNPHWTLAEDGSVRMGR